jgi:hypothetical protein
VRLFASDALASVALPRLNKNAAVWVHTLLLKPNLLQAFWKSEAAF